MGTRVDESVIRDKIDALRGPVRDKVWFEMHAEIIKPILEANPGWEWGDAVKHLEATGRWDAAKQAIDRNFEARVEQRLEDELVKAFGADAFFKAMVRSILEGAT
jgi:hypothetical protein